MQKREPTQWRVVGSMFFCYGAHLEVKEDRWSCDDDLWFSILSKSHIFIIFSKINYSDTKVMLNFLFKELRQQDPVFGDNGEKFPDLGQHLTVLY